MTVLIIISVIAVLFLGGITILPRYYNLGSIKSRTVGDGQHGTARFATQSEIDRTYKCVEFDPKLWRKHPQKQSLPQGIVAGCKTKHGKTYALVDDSDVHALMVGAAGIGKTAFFLMPNLEYCCACGMSFMSSDSKGDLYRVYGKIAHDIYGYKVAVIDLRNITRSDGNNILHLVTKYMDLYKAEPDNISYKAKAEKYAKIIAKTVITSGNDGGSYGGDNAYFYDSAEGLLTSAILLVAEFCKPEERHIISVFKMIQDLLGPSGVPGKTQFQLLLDLLPSDHKARWFAGAALSSSEQGIASVMSTALSKLNAFIDSEMEQCLCFDTAIDAETFCNEKSAIFVVLAEEDSSRHFMVSLIVQQLYREILAVADENGGKLKSRVMFFLDEFGSATRS